MSASAKRLRLDRSQPFATISGQRQPGDKHQFAHSVQNGIYFDAEGLHIDDLVEDDETRALVDRRLKRASAAKSDGESGGGQESKGSGSQSSGAGDVNLEAWLRGEERYQWFQITKTVRDRYSMNITKMNDMLDFLVTEKQIVPLDKLSPEYAAIMKPAS